MDREEVSKGMSGYIRRTPGLKCTRCGGDNSARSKNTKYCFACAKEVAKEQRQKRAKYLKELERRDTIQDELREHCIESMRLGYNFCSQCGQRLR